MQLNLYIIKWKLEVQNLGKSDPSIDSKGNSQIKHHRSYSTLRSGYMDHGSVGVGEAHGSILESSILIRESWSTDLVCGSTMLVRKLFSMQIHYVGKQLVIFNLQAVQTNFWRIFHIKLPVNCSRNLVNFKNKFLKFQK